MEKPRYKKLKNSKFYVKLVGDNNLHIRQTALGYALDINGSPNEYYEGEDFIGCSREEFDNEYKKAAKQLNEITKI